MSTIWLLWAATGMYEIGYHIPWAFTTEEGAATTSTRLNNLVAEWKMKHDALECPDPMDDAKIAEFDRWRKASDRLAAKYRKASGDKSMEMDTQYSVGKVSLRSRT